MPCSKKSVETRSNIPSAGGPGFYIPDELVGSPDYCDRNTVYGWTLDLQLGQNYRNEQIVVRTQIQLLPDVAVPANNYDIKVQLTTE